MLIQSHRQEGISRAYIQAIVAQTGLAWSFGEYDYGIDLTVHSILRRGHRHFDSGFKLDIQVKSTTRAKVDATQVICDLDVMAYDHLRDRNAGTPRILVLLVMPADPSQWTEQSEDCLEIRRCAYWMSLKEFNPTTNTATVRVAIPRENVFSVDAVGRLMDKVRKREAL